MRAVPVIDISRGRAEVAREVARAVEEIGFLVVAGHGVPRPAVPAMRAAARALFARPEEEKAGLSDRAGTLNRGYTPFRSEFNGSTRTNRAPADLREGFIFGPFDLPDDPYYAAPEAGFAYQDNIWPAGAGETVAAFKAYYRALEALNVDLLRIFADALGLPRGFFLDKFDRHASTVRVLHYPAQTEPPEEGQIRCGAHTDFGSHTILLAD
ncbi:MAG: isopenicillin N synthase family oxygenase, partial [Defluviicoccus sp.]|nr:isopenicillin N synthase family oxygenase [Defluviicoccus sp.]